MIDHQSSHFAPGALVVAVASGAVGVASSIAQWFTLANTSALMSFASMAVGCGVLVYGKVRAAGRQDHVESVESTGEEVRILVKQNRDLLDEIMRRNQTILELTARLAPIEHSDPHHKDDKPCQDESKSTESL